MSLFQQTAKNYILIFPGVRWGSTDDKISCFASRYDTLPGTAGVDSNGSGIAALLEVARMLAYSSNSCYRINSVILVALGMESDVSCLDNGFLKHHVLVSRWSFLSRILMVAAYIISQ